MAWLPVIASQACENARRRLLAGSQFERLRQIFNAGRCCNDFARSSQPFQLTSYGQRTQDRDRAATIGDFECLTGLHTTKQFAGPLSQFSYTYLCHVLFVAHYDVKRRLGTDMNTDAVHSHNARGH